jgi:hypothetical protein
MRSVCDRVRGASGAREKLFYGGRRWTKVDGCEWAVALFLGTAGRAALHVASQLSNAGFDSCYARLDGYSLLACLWSEGLRYLLSSPLVSPSSPSVLTLRVPWLCSSLSLASFAFARSAASFRI